MIIRDAGFSIPFFLITFISADAIKLGAFIDKKFSTLLEDYNEPLITLLIPSFKRTLLQLMSIPGLHPASLWYVKI